MLSATGDATQWTFTLRADDHETVSAFQECCRARGVEITVHRLVPFADDEPSALTPAQFEALRTAYDRGYYDEPRRVALDELSADLEIGRQSLAGRLRRAHRNLLSSFFGEGGRVAPSPTDR